MKTRFTILVLAAALSSLQAQRSSSDLSEKNGACSQLKRLAETAGPAGPAIAWTPEPFRPKTPSSGIG